MSVDLNGKQAKVVQRINIEDAFVCEEVYEVRLVETGARKFLNRLNLVGGRPKGALATVNMLNNRLSNTQATLLATVLKDHATLKSLCGNKGDETVLNMSGKQLGVDGAMMLAPELADNRALVSANVLYNDIGGTQAHAMVRILQEHPTLKSLCGNMGNETELYMAGTPSNRMTADDATMLAPELIANEALTSLTMASNALGAEGAEVVAQAIRQKVSMSTCMCCVCVAARSICI